MTIIDPNKNMKYKNTLILLQNDCGSGYAPQDCKAETKSDTLHDQTMSDKAEQQTLSTDTDKTQSKVKDTMSY